MSAVPVLAVALDHALAEPPARVHPVVWMGRYCTWAGDWLGRVRTPPFQAVAGAVALTAGVAGVGAAALALHLWLARLRRPLALAIEAAILSTLLSARMLEDEVARVEAEVGRSTAGDLAAARRAVAGLVSRDVSDLDADQIREAALESLAENASDAVVAPLLWYAVAGLPAAAAYRFINTVDAMWGYRTPAWEWRGKVAARADDLANWWPARLTAVLLAPGVGVSQVARAARVTPSPNAGWPMAALALRLGVRLRKPNVYTLHRDGRTARSQDVDRAIRALRRVTAVATIAAALATERRP
jgi:adenosylcobinamide-phosphate synthase